MKVNYTLHSVLQVGYEHGRDRAQIVTESRRYYCSARLHQPTDGLESITSILRFVLGLYADSLLRKN